MKIITSNYTGNEISLLNCPFCDGMPELIHVGNSHTSIRAIKIRCLNCNSMREDKSIKNDFKWLENVAIRAWNRRATL